MKFNEIYQKLCEAIDNEKISFTDEELKKVVSYFSVNKGITKIDRLATQMNVSESHVNRIIYNIVETLFGGGESKKNNFNKRDINSQELRMGIDVEYEHTIKSSPSATRIATKIALDHLAELPDYYTRLKEMEKTGKTDLKNEI
jgi:AraC-like DNA-binding protein